MRASAAHLDHQTGLQAHLVGDGQVAKAKAAALVLHGGRETSYDAVQAHQLAVLRMVPIARRLVTVGGDHGLAVWRLLFRHRGWNSEAAHPMEDVDWALRQLRLRHGDVPIVLVGHSMGGRAAIRAAGELGVAGVVGLAPWLPPGEPYDQLAGRRLLVVHGSRDRLTSAKHSHTFTHAARSLAAEATYVGLNGCGHTMLRRARLWNRLTSEFVLHTTFGAPPTGPFAEALAAGDIVF